MKTHMKTQRNRIFRAPLKWAKALVVAVFFLALAVMATQQTHAQLDDYNPYVIQGIVDQTGTSNGSTLLPVEFGGTGFVRFDVGQAGSSPLPFPSPNTPGDVVTLVITLSKGVPNVSDPNNPVDALSALSGDGVAWFDWTYDPGIRTYTAVQKVTIPGSAPGTPSRENITIAYKVAENSFLSASPTTSNGLKVNLQPPGYTNPQPTDDDQVESYTYVEAYDYGDNPTTGSSPDGAGTNNYGSADHAINLAKLNGLYEEYMYLGASVDPESANQASTGADGDDNNQSNVLNLSNDEDGVVFPDLIRNETVTIPVVVTIVDEDPFSDGGRLNAWIDWNGDGDFGDSGEYIPGGTIYESGTRNLTVNVPSDAIITAPTFARFRFGKNIGSSGSATFGEVEDYRVTIYDEGFVPVTLSYFVATDTDAGVTIDWQTATETANMGFNLYVQSEDGLKQINQEMILSPEMSSLRSTDYTYSSDGGGDVFYIEDVSTYGKAKRFGPFALGQTYGRKAAETPIDWAAINAGHDTKAADQNALAIVNAQERVQQSRALNSSSGPLLTLGVSQSGLYRVTHADLLAAGLDLIGSNLDDVAVAQGNTPVPITVTGNAGLFDASSTIEFYGQAIDTLYSKENVYTLHLDAALADRAAADGSTPSGVTSGHYLETVNLGDDNKYEVVSHGDSPWYDSRLTAYNGADSKSFNIDVDNYVPGAAMSALRVTVLGLSEFNASPDHHGLVDFAGTNVGEFTFDGLASYLFETNLAEGLVQNGPNTLNIKLPDDLPVPWDVVGVDTYSLTYPRSFVAKEDGQLTFTAAGTAFQVDGLPSATVVVYRYDAGSGTLTQLTNVTVTGAVDNYSATFAGSGVEETYLVYSSDHLLTPDLRAARPYTDITTGTTDYLMISHADFITDLAPLVAFHEGNGLTVTVVDVADVYDQYSDGIFTPQAIKDYLQYADANMDVEYVLLVGGDTYDYDDNLGLGSISFIPSPYVSTDATVNFAPSDPYLADVDGDLSPDLRIGRFPVRTGAELTEMINKTLIYAGADYKETAVFSADRVDGSSFTDISNGFASYLPGNWDIDTAYLDEMATIDAHNLLVGSINDGVGLTSFVGHSGSSQWTWEGLFDADDAGALTNVGQPTAVTQWGCWNTYHVSPYYSTLSHKFMQGDSGAAIVLGAATLTSAQNEDLLGQAFMGYVAQGNMSFGEALQLAKIDLESSSPGLLDVQLGYTLLGDPALSLAETTGCAPAPTPTNVTIAKNDSSVELNWNDMGVGVDHYEVWQNSPDNFYFTPVGDCAASADCTVVNGTSLALGNVDVNTAYMVVAVNSCGSQSPMANAHRVGVFNFPIQPGSTP